MDELWLMAGLVLIVVGWIMQLYYGAARKIYALSLKFVLFYTVGCVLLVIDGISRGDMVGGIAYGLTAVVAVLAGYFSKKARPRV